MSDAGRAGSGSPASARPAMPPASAARRLIDPGPEVMPFLLFR
jgi:hypothetical protein